MATKEEVKIILTADNKTKKGFGDTEKGLNRLNDSAKKLGKTLTLGVAAGFTATVFAGKKALDKFFIQEKALARLDATTSNVLTSFKGMEKGTEAFNQELKRSKQLLTEQASSLQKLTTFGDEQIISAQALAGTFALDAEAIAKLTPRILDMSASLEKAGGAGADLESVTIAVGKAMTNGVGSLSRYGVVISDAAEKAFNLADEQGKLDIITQELDKNFKGIAETVGLTAAGKIVQMQNAIGDLWEIIGGAIAEAIMPFIGHIQKFAEDPKFQNKIKIMVEKILEFGKVALPAAIQVAKVFSTVIGGLWELFVKIGEAIGTVIFKIDQLIEKMKKLSSVGGSFSLQNIGTSFKNLPANLGFRAHGGTVSSGQPVVVGERGPELFVPPSAGRIATSTRGAGGGVTVNINNPVIFDDTMMERMSMQVGDLLRSELRI